MYTYTVDDYYSTYAILFQIAAIGKLLSIQTIIRVSYYWGNKKVLSLKVQKNVLYIHIKFFNLGLFLFINLMILGAPKTA